MEITALKQDYHLKTGQKAKFVGTTRHDNQKRTSYGYSKVNAITYPSIHLVEYFFLII